MTGNVIADHYLIAVLLLSIFLGDAKCNLYHDAIPAAVIIIPSVILTGSSAPQPTMIIYEIPGNLFPLPYL